MIRRSRATLLRRLAALRTEEAALLLELADLDLMTEPADTYSSVDLPRHATRRTFCESCASGRVVGAVKIGRIWTCPREAWHALRAHKPKPAPMRVVDSLDPETLAQRAFDAAGFRATRLDAKTIARRALEAAGLRRTTR